MSLSAHGHRASHPARKTNPQKYNLNVVSNRERCSKSKIMTKKPVGCLDKICSHPSRYLSNKVLHWPPKSTNSAKDSTLIPYTIDSTSSRSHPSMTRHSALIHYTTETGKFILTYLASFSFHVTSITSLFSLQPSSMSCVSSGHRRPWLATISCNAGIT